MSKREAAKKAAIITAITGALFFTCANIYAIFKLKQLRDISYRAHEKYTTGKRYESNINEREETAFGDLCAISGAQNEQQCSFSAGKRTAKFETDSRGWKTSETLENSDFVIVGDSFLGALGGDGNNAQLGQELKKLTGKKFYEAAHPGDPGDYLLRIEELERENPLGKKYVVMVFEGNDLAVKSKSIGLSLKPYQPEGNPFLFKVRHSLDRLLYDLKNPPLAKLLSIYLESERLQRLRSTHVAADASFTLPFNDKLHAFGVNNQLVSRDPDLSLPKSLDPAEMGYVGKKIKCLVFIPTKYSAYLAKRTLLERHPLLIDDFRRLTDSGIRVIDLTPPLSKVARSGNNNQDPWWTDDTHWNHNGIKVAARTIARDSSCLR